jgi:NNP family nitrate/nitrite transporter-like MFS transporter
MMNGAVAHYFEDKFDMEGASASVLVSMLIWMNLFMRAWFGGFARDTVNESLGVRGRMLVLAFLLLCPFSAAIMVFLVFSLFVQACEGATFGIVPYISPSLNGSVAGIVGACGNTGAVCFGLYFVSTSANWTTLSLFCDNGSLDYRISSSFRVHPHR